MYEMENENLSSHIKDRQLSAVCFVKDYLQLQFDGATLTITCKTSVQDHLGEIEWKEVGFRDRICGIITNIVAETEITSVRMTITFENQAKIIATIGSYAESIAFSPGYPSRDPADFWVID